jgi:hypothetical protein
MMKKRMTLGALLLKTARSKHAVTKVSKKDAREIGEAIYYRASKAIEEIRRERSKKLRTIR